MPTCADGKVIVVSYTDNAVALETNATDNCLLVSSEVYYPGWRAWTDEQATKILRVNSSFRGVQVPRGRHRIFMRFKPEWLLPMSLFSGLSLMVALTLCWWKPA